MRADTQIRSNQLRVPRERDVTGIPLAHSGAHVRHGIVELVLQRERQVVLARVDDEPVAVAQPVEIEHLLQHTQERYERIPQPVRDHERKPRFGQL